MNIKTYASDTEKNIMPLKAWLDCLQGIIPCEGVLLIGAGNGTTDLAEWTFHQPVSSWLVEGDRTQFERLERAISDQNTQFPYCYVMSGDTEPVNFHKYNNPARNGVLPLNKLNKLWPQLIQVEERVVNNPMTIDLFVKNESVTANWLFIDCEASDELLKGASSTLAAYHMVILFSSQEDFNDQVLTSSGFNLVSCIPGRHPATRLIIYQRDFQLLAKQEKIAASQIADSSQASITQLQTDLADTKQLAQVQTETIQQLEKQLSETQQSSKAKQEKITVLESQLAETKQSAKANQEAFTALEAKHAALEEEKTKIHTYFMSRKKQAEEGEEKIKALTEANTSLEQAKKTLQAEKESLSKDLETTKASLNTTQQALNQAQATIEALQNNSNQLQKLEEKMSALFSKQGQTMQEYTNALGQHVTRTAKSTTQNIESFLGVQKYLVQDGTPLQLNGSRLSAELALKLTERLHNTHYDLIIEFGTGTSTQLLAKALLKQERDKPHSQHLISRDSDDAYSTDLPKRIISFEHDKKAIAPLAEQLEQQGLASLVELIFAPLSDYTHKGEDYLFYECKSKLKQLAQVFDQREAKVLVWVDGPDTPDKFLSRYPVLPLLLKHLATHQLDIIVNQSHKHLPDELMANWQSLLNKRCLAFNTQHLTHEKDATLLQINGE